MRLVQFPQTNDNVNVEMALANAVKADLDSVVIVGYNKDGDFLMWSAKMTNANVVYALLTAQKEIIGG